VVECSALASSESYRGQIPRPRSPTECLSGIIDSEVTSESEQAKRPNPRKSQQRYIKKCCKLKLYILNDLYLLLVCILYEIPSLKTTDV
jgi:hypothetical protein